MMKKKIYLFKGLFRLAIASTAFISLNVSANYQYEISRTLQSLANDGWDNHCEGEAPGPKDIVIICNGYFGDGITFRVVREIKPQLQISTRLIYLVGKNDREDMTMKNSYLLFGVSQELFAGFRLGTDIGISSFARNSETLFSDSNNISYGLGFFAERPTKIINNFGINLKVGMLTTQVNDFYKGKTVISGLGFDIGIIF